MLECGAGPDHQIDEIIYTMQGDHLDLIVNNPRGDGSGRFGPAPDRILSAAIRCLAVAFVHTRLIVYRPGNMRVLTGQVVLKQQVSIRSRVMMIAINDVNVGLDPGFGRFAMQVIPHGVAYQAGPDPAVVNSERRHRAQR